MAYDIHPLSFSELLDRGFRLLIDNFALFVGINLVVFLPYGFLLALVQPHAASGAMPGPGVGILSLLFLMIGVPLAYMALATAIAAAYLDRPTTIGDSYRAVLPILLPVIGTDLLVGILLILALIALVVPGIYFGVCWVFILVVMIVERKFGMGAASRSRQLVSGVWWYTLGVMVVSGLIASVPAGILQIIWARIPFLGPILTQATQAVTSTYSTIVLIVYYFDRRVRTEGFDLKLLAEHVRENMTARAATAGVSPVG